jgi:hypothetical protein
VLETAVALSPSLIRRLGPAAILAIGFAAFLVYAYPGFLSIDSAMQLVEARSGQFSDWHPPAMAALWRLVEHVITGPLGMLLLQSGAFLIGAAMLYRRVLGPFAAAIAATLTLLFPPIIVPLAVIWKDSQMAGYLVLGFALILDDRRRKWLGVAVLAVATAMRANAAAATLPLFALGVWAAITIAAMTANHVLTKAQSHAWHTSIAPADIAGILEFSRKYSDDELLTVFEGTPLIAHEKIFINARKNYTPISWWRVVNGPDRIFDWPTNEEQRAALTRAWWTLVRDNPLAYLDHRAHVFREVLGFSNSPLFDPVAHTRVPIEYAVPLDLPPDARRSQDAIARKLAWISVKTFLFRAWVYFVLALAFIPLAWRHRELIALYVSGLLYELSLFPFAPSPDVRYSHWLMTTTVIATVMLVYRRMSAWRLASARTSTAEATTVSAVAVAAPSGPSSGISVY